MKKLLMILILLLVAIPMSVFSANTTKTLTFQWDQPEFIVGTGNLNYLKEWKIYWSATSGNSYDPTPVAIIQYDPNTGGTTFTSPAETQVIGDPGTKVIKYFVAVACGDVPKQDGTTEYKCSGDSNEISYEFWIPIGQFSVPINFQITTQ